MGWSFYSFLLKLCKRLLCAKAIIFLKLFCRHCLFYAATLCFWRKCKIDFIWWNLCYARTRVFWGSCSRNNSIYIHTPHHSKLILIYVKQNFHFTANSKWNIGHINKTWCRVHWVYLQFYGFHLFVRNLAHGSRSTVFISSSPSSFLFGFSGVHPFFPSKVLIPGSSRVGYRTGKAKAKSQDQGDEAGHYGFPPREVARAVTGWTHFCGSRAMLFDCKALCLQVLNERDH